MISYQITSTVIGICVAATIFWLVRRGHLHGPYAIWWIAAAITVGTLSFFPRLFDYLAVYAGVKYPPILAIVLALGLLLLKILTMDVERSRQERAIRRLAQRVAMLEASGPIMEPQGAERNVDSQAPESSVVSGEIVEAK